MGANIKERQNVFFDMEAYAAALFCQERGLPFHCLKAVSDNLDGTLSATVRYGAAGRLLMASKRVKGNRIDSGSGRVPRPLVPAEADDTSPARSGPVAMARLNWVFVIGRVAAAARGHRRRMAAPE